MLRPRAVAVHRFLFKGIFIAWAFATSTFTVAAGSEPFENTPGVFVVEAPGYLARINRNAPDEVYSALKRAETWFISGRVEKLSQPLTFVLHGPEISIFFRDNYLQHKQIVDLAARLTAFEVVEINICQTQMGVQGKEHGDLVPFVETVPFGPATIKQLINEENYLSF